MITIQEAIDLVLKSANRLADEEVEVAQSLGRVLANDIRSDVDSPPHDKSLVDGFAIQAADTDHPPVELQILEDVFAGQTPLKCLRSGQATRIMTGAPLPKNADAVVMVEHTKTINGNPEAVVIGSKLSPETNVQRRAAVFSANEIVIERGNIVRPIEIGLMSEVGYVRALVVRQPNVAILPTGDELVEPHEQPPPGKIRNSNGPMLSALVSASHGIPHVLEVGRDDPDQLKRQIELGLQDNVLVMSGGVSMGQRDLVPVLLQELGVRPVFHRVQLRPGKPIWFGYLKKGESRTLVFGLPGNPLSSFVCCHLFVIPAIRKLIGLQAVEALPSMQLVEKTKVSGNRPAFLPAKIQQSDPSAVIILPWNGSADQRTLSKADGMAFFPEPGTYQKGHQVDFLTI